VREFNGYVTRIAQHGTHGRYYRFVATVHPWLWFLTRTSDCRTFQEMTVPEIVEAVFADHPAEYKLELTGTYRKWTYCVQYRETDFNFVSRLLEHEGIYYYFKHVDGQNLLVVTDSYSGHEAFPEYEELPIVGPDRLVRPDLEHITSWECGRQVQPGAYALRDYDLERPQVELLTLKKSPRPYSLSEYEMYDYPGHYLKKPEGEQYVAVRIDEHGSQFEDVEATTNARGVAVGYLLKVTGHPRTDQNREHLVVSASHDLEFSDYEAMPDRGGASYSCSFTAMSSQQQFRPRRVTPKPFVQGPQTAVVVGPAGEEIHTDKFGRIKVQFHWDRYGKHDENSSCWIRVSQTWAGKGWGSIIIPRIDQEVIVDFLEGDPDQPIVTGCVYNGDNPPPFALPGAGVVSGLKSNTHKGKGMNEMSMDDTAGKEKITIHAQYDMGTTVLHDQTNTVNGKFTEVIDKDTSITVKTGKLEHKVNTGTASYYVKGAMTQKFDNVWESKVTGKVLIKANSDITIDSDTKITLVTGSSQLVMESGGAISLTGIKITVNGKDTVNVSSPNKTEVTGGAEAKFGTGGQNVVTSTAKTAISGAAINSSAVGMHEITGAVVKIN
jgi:type VI secretion system secreted protein VgrG